MVGKQIKKNKTIICLTHIPFINPNDCLQRWRLETFFFDRDLEKCQQFLYYIFTDSVIVLILCLLQLLLKIYATACNYQILWKLSYEKYHQRIRAYIDQILNYMSDIYNLVNEKMPVIFQSGRMKYFILTKLLYVT